MSKPKKYTKIFGVEGKVKKFNEDLSNKYDIKARDIIKKILGDAVCDNPNIYGEDMIVKCKDIIYKFIELQVCAEWDTPKFPYKFPFVYARKMRFSNDTLFITFNRDFTKLILFDRLAIDEKPTRLIKYSRELVNLVGWGKVLQLDIEDFNLNSIKMYLGKLDE